jgi:hypothetical protein
VDSWYRENLGFHGRGCHGRGSRFYDPGVRVATVGGRAGRPALDEVVACGWTAAAVAQVADHLDEVVACGWTAAAVAQVG